MTKSIRPGRLPSSVAAVMALAAAVFGVIWIGAANAIGAPGFFSLFGIVFIIIAIVLAVVCVLNATGKYRFSMFDVTEQPDRSARNGPQDGTDGDYCPYCGSPTPKGFDYCRHCGKKLP